MPLQYLTSSLGWLSWLVARLVGCLDDASWWISRSTNLFGQDKKLEAVNQEMRQERSRIEDCCAHQTLLGDESSIKYQLRLIKVLIEVDK